MKYFKLEEFTDSPTAKSKGIDNTPSKETIQNLNRLVITILDPLREAWGKPIQITSGYRSPALNKAIGGSATSAHVDGRAADLNIKGINIPAIAKVAINLKLPFDQIISEYGSWVHIGIAKEGSTPRKQLLIIDKESTGGRYITWWI